MPEQELFRLTKRFLCGTIYADGSFRISLGGSLMPGASGQPGGFPRPVFLLALVDKDEAGLAVLGGAAVVDVCLMVLSGPEFYVVPGDQRCAAEGAWRLQDAHAAHRDADGLGRVAGHPVDGDDGDRPVLGVTVVAVMPLASAMGI